MAGCGERTPSLGLTVNINEAAFKQESADNRGYRRATAPDSTGRSACCQSSIPAS